MVTDPATTPSEPRAQVAFGASVAAVYGVLMTAHVVFGLFFSLSIVSALRGAWAYARLLAPAPWPARSRVVPAAVLAGVPGARREPALLALEREP
jgi:hypothetical protein